MICFTFYYLILASSSSTLISILQTLLDIDLLDLDIPSIKLGYFNSQNAVLQPGRNAIDINLSRVRSAAQSHFAFEGPDLSLIESKSLQQFLIARSIYDAGNAELGFLSIPVDADVFFLRTRKRDVDDEGLGRVENVDFWGEVFGFGVFGRVVLVLSAE